MPNKIWNVYLSGEIHTDWRTELAKASAEANLPVSFSSPVLDHSASDNCGVAIMGEESNPFWKDHKGASVNAIRTRTLLSEADIVVVRFGEKYKQWNAAFEAGFASAVGIPIIVQHQPEHIHALKEIDAAALAVVATIDQIVATLKYVTQG